MADKEKLIKLLYSVSCESELEGEPGSCQDRINGRCREVDRLDSCAIQHMADHLIANGVTIVDNHVGKTAYGIWDVSEYRTRAGNVRNRNARINRMNELEWVRIFGKAEVRPRVCTKSDLRCLGKTLFWTREEAERVIQYGTENG